MYRDGNCFIIKLVHYCLDWSMLSATTCDQMPGVTTFHLTVCILL